jgi:hypothetical protein
VTPEGRVKAKVNAALKPHIDANHIWKFMPVQMGLGIPALDYLLCVCGMFVAIETKVPGKKPTPRQELTMAALTAAGAKVFVVDDEISLGEAMVIIRSIINEQHRKSLRAAAGEVIRGAPPCPVCARRHPADGSCGGT